MLMGKLVSQTKYKRYEYATAVLISVGMAAFLLGSNEGKKGKVSTMSLYDASHIIMVWQISN